MIMSSFDDGAGKYTYNSSTPTATIQLDQRAQTKTSRNPALTTNQTTTMHPHINAAKGMPLSQLGTPSQVS
jgi:hypothetical protein